MSGHILTVDAAAALLQLHPKTVLRFIREGRLRATRVGRSYRVLRSDIEAFAGAEQPAAAQLARTTCIVDVDAVDAALMQRLSSLLLGSAQGGVAADPPISLDLAHDPVRNSLKVIIRASPADAAALLRLVDACLTNPASLGRITSGGSSP